MNHGEKLRKIRTRKELSQEYVAKKIGKSQKAYSNLERKAIIDEKKLNDIINALEITKEEFENFVDEFSIKKQNKKEEDLLTRRLLKLVSEQAETIKKLMEYQFGDKKQE